MGYSVNEFYKYLVTFVVITTDSLVNFSHAMLRTYNIDILSVKSSDGRTRILCIRALPPKPIRIGLPVATPKPHNPSPSERIPGWNALTTDHSGLPKTGSLTR